MASCCKSDGLISEVSPAAHNEVGKAMSNLKQERAAGPDGLNSESIKNDGQF